MTDRQRWPAPMPLRRELLVAAGLTLVGMAIVTWAARQNWFYGDSWDFLLGRSINDPASLLAPHNGHLQLPIALVHQALYRTVGFEYWPWYWLPRVLGYGAMCWTMWVVIRRRGAEPAVAWIALAAGLILGPSAVANATTIGPFLVLPMLALAAAIYVGGGPRAGRELAVFTLLLVGMVVTTSSGLAAVAALGVTGVVIGRLRSTWPAFAAAAIVYGAWWLMYRGEGAGTGGIDADVLVELPTALPEMLGAALSRAVALPLAYGPALAIAVGLVIVVWVIRRRLGVFEWVWLATAAIYMAMVVVARIAPGRLEPDAVRFSFVAIWLLVPAIVPNIRLPNDEPARRIVTASVALAVVVGNLAAFRTEANVWEDVSRGVRTHVEAVALLIADGEPFIDGSDLVLPAGGGARRGLMTVGAVREFMANGLLPPSGGVDTDDLELARGVMRITITVGGVASDCSSVGVDESVSVDTATTRRVTLRADVPTEITLTVHDAYGTGMRPWVLQGRRTVTLAEGSVGGLDVAVDAGSPIEVCLPAE